MKNTLIFGAFDSNEDIKKDILTIDASAVIDDVNGTVYADIADGLKANGVNVKAVNTLDFNKSDNYNPFNYFKDDSDITDFVNTIIKKASPDEDKGGDNEFFPNVERLMYSAFVYYLRDFATKEDVKNFTGMMAMFDSLTSDENAVDRLFDSLPKDSFAYRDYFYFKKAAGSAMKSVVISGVIRLRPFFSKGFEKLTSTDNIQLNDIRSVKTALFVIGDDLENVYSPLTNILYKQIFKAAKASGEKADSATSILPVNYIVPFNKEPYKINEKKLSEIGKNCDDMVLRNWKGIDWDALA